MIECKFDWRIHKRLREERLKRNYLYLARKNSKWNLIDHFIQSIEYDRTMKAMNAKHIFVKPPKSYGPYDHDLWDHLDSAMIQQTLYKELCRQEIQKNSELLLQKSLDELKIKTFDDDVHNHRLFNDWYIYGTRLNDAFVVVTKTD